MIIYFADRKMNILGLASTELPRGLTLTEDMKTEEIETGVATFSCRIPFQPDTRKLVELCAAAGNYIFRYDGDANEFYTIVETEVDTEAGDVYLYAEDAGLDLINEVALQWPTDATAAADRGAHPLAWYFDKLLTSGTYAGGDTGGGDTGFEIGINEASGDTAQELTWSDEATVTERLLDIAGKFECEIGFRFQIDGMAVTHKYVDVYKKRGKDLGVQLRMGVDVERILTKTSIANLATALKVTGGESAAGTPVNLEGYTYDDGDFYVASGSLLRSREAHDKWSRYIYAQEPETAKSGTGDIVKPFTSETVNQKKLCEEAIAELKQACEPEINYEVELTHLPASVKIGDRVTIVDDEGEQYLSARILKLETSETEDTRTVTLGEYLIRDSGISAQVAELAAKFQTMAKARSFYTWIAYADDETGTGITLNPDGRRYMGVSANHLEQEPDLTDPAVYTWSLIKGTDGTDGTDGQDGVDGYDGVSVISITPYYCLSATQPSKPTTNPPGGAWATAEPAYVSGSSDNLYTTDLQAFSDGSFSYSEVTLSSSYEAARDAYEKAVTAKSAADDAAATANGKSTAYYAATQPDGTDFRENDIWFDTGDGNKMYYWNGTAWTAATYGAGAIASGAVTTEKLAAGAVKASKIDVDDLFAQDITATGTIKGATLEGAELTGEDIDIACTPADAEDVSMMRLKTFRNITSMTSANLYIGKDTSDGSGGMNLEGMHYVPPYIVLDTVGYIDLVASRVRVTTDCDATTYDTFSGNVVSSGSITVVKKLGWCQVFGAVTPNASSSSWVTILDSTKVPAPQHGTAMYMTVPYWSSSYSIPIRFRLRAAGGLDIARGTANGSYWFTVTYPIA